MHSRLANLESLLTKVALLEHQMAELRSGRDRWVLYGGCCSLALVGAVAGSLLTYFLEGQP